MISIQKAGPVDAALLAGIAVQTFIETHEAGVPAVALASYVSTRLTSDNIKQELNDPGNLFHIIYYNGQAAGYSKIIFSKPCHLIDSAAVTKLERLYLLKAFHDLKLGAALFRFVTSLSKNANQQGIWLYVWNINERAIRFYSKAGFTIIGNEDFKISDTHSNPNYIMYLHYQPESADKPGNESIPG